MSDRKEFNDFCDKNGITNLTAGLQLFEQCYDKNKVCCENCIFDDDIHYDGNDDEMDMDDDKCMECTNYDCFEPKENK